MIQGIHNANSYSNYLWLAYITQDSKAFEIKSSIKEAICSVPVRIHFDLNS